ncbi:Protein required for attachment to host cells [Sulfitobacter sp. THAF37]|uniref:host attachment family protein n=1 Tax=Sulfitobacter sp. THAF37 TaxID=2587855 RepID=UPI0012691E21|nr:host attachment family protein [Sulfitobacter sp. THAF37]QFT59437.1 Protein required for attachment to host cells [Sulfitobacter sp. THAF37]
MTKLTNGTWVLIADGEKALFLVNQTDGEDPYLEVFREEEQENPPNREQAANRRGRFNDGPSVHRSAVQDTDWHQLAKDRFASDLADILYRKAHQGAFDRLVVVAPPNTLGELRNEVHKEVADKIVAEVPKTLTNHPIDEIEKLVAQEIAA